MPCSWAPRWQSWDPGGPCVHVSLLPHPFHPAPAASSSKPCFLSVHLPLQPRATVGFVPSGPASCLLFDAGGVHWRVLLPAGLRWLLSGAGRMGLAEGRTPPCRVAQALPCLAGSSPGQGLTTPTRSISQHCFTGRGPFPETEKRFSFPALAKN